MIALVNHNRKDSESREENKISKFVSDIFIPSHIQSSSKTSYYHSNNPEIDRDAFCYTRNGTSIGKLRLPSSIKREAFTNYVPDWETVPYIGWP